MQKQQEKLLREFIRKTFVSNLLREQREEHAVRLYVRSLISEVREERTLSTLFEAKIWQTHIPILVLTNYEMLLGKQSRLLNQNINN